MTNHDSGYDSGALPRPRRRNSSRPAARVGRAKPRYRWHQPNVKALGVVYEQKFYGRLEPAGPGEGTDEASFFPPESYSAMVECRRAAEPERLRALAWTLLNSGCVALHVIGEPRAAATLSAAFDAYRDRRAFGPDLTVHSSLGVNEDGSGWRETLAEALPWFILPNGEGTRMSLVAVIGGRSDFADLVRQFARAVGDLRECIMPAAPTIIGGGAFGGFFPRAFD